MDPTLASKIVPLVSKLDPEVNKVVKEFAGYFKTRLVRARPDDERRAASQTTKRPEIEFVPSRYPLPDDTVEAAGLEMPGNEWSAIS